MEPFKPSELIINKNGSIFHLCLKPDHISDIIILVGDPNRVEMVSRYFDKIEIKIQNREFITHTGYFKKNKLTVISTGIGIDNIDIVLNELDALANIDLKNRTQKKEHTTLRLIRIGTSGAIQMNIPLNSVIISKMAVGFDGLLNFYANRNKVCNLEIEQAFIRHTNWSKLLPSPYFVYSSDQLFNQLGKNINSGITVSAPGFYGPQGRIIRLPVFDPDLNKKLENFDYQGLKITNYEMESSALFGLSKLLGHEAVTLCAIIANRAIKTYNPDYNEIMEKLILNTLEQLTG